MLPAMRVGLTGGIGSGKSEVARRLAARGAVVIDYDLLAREVVEPGSEGLQAVVEAFGTEILDADGRLDRERLASAVFSDDAARAVLNAIVHPRVGARAAERAREAPPDAVVVHDIPLLVENGLAPAFDAVVVVVAEPETQVRRLVARGLSEGDAQARMAVQATDVERRAVATHVVENDGGMDELDARVGVLWQELRGTVAHG